MHKFSGSTTTFPCEEIQPYLPARRIRTHLGATAHLARRLKPYATAAPTLRSDPVCTPPGPGWPPPVAGACRDELQPSQN
eukprot:6974763-Prymnesium_polylepis.2